MDELMDTNTHNYPLPLMPPKRQHVGSGNVMDYAKTTQHQNKN